MTEPQPSIESLLDKVIDNTKQVVQFMRRRFLWTWLAISLLALLTCMSLILSTRAAETNLQQTDDIARVAQHDANAAQETSDQTVAYLKGEQGIPGVPGANGVNGAPGQPSSEPGPPGAAGAPGAKGDVGQPGANGTSGSTGLSGANGPMGPVGIAGASGTNGKEGAPGTPGTQGHEGEQGPVGPIGPQGPPGPGGPAGAPGPAGPQGEPGATGPTPVVTTTTSFAASANDTAASKQVTANCPNGRISGGGFAVVPSDPGIIVTASSPVGVTGWSATAEVLSLPAGTNWQILAFAQCVVTQ